MKRRTPPRAEKTAFAASPDVGEHLNSDAKTPRGLNQNRRRPRQKATCCATPRTSGQVERPESPRMRESIRLSPKRRGKACRNVARRRRPAPPESAPPRGKERLRVLSADMPPAAGDRAASGRASGMFRPPCSLARTARGSRRARRAGQADEPRFCAVKKRARRPSMAPKREKSNKKGFPLPDKAAKGKPCLCSWGSVNPCTSRRRCSCRKDEWSEPAHGSSSRRARPRSRTGCGRCPCVHGCP